MTDVLFFLVKGGKGKSVSEFNYRSIVHVSSTSGDEITVGVSNPDKINSAVLAGQVPIADTTVYLCALDASCAQVLKHIYVGISKYAFPKPATSIVKFSVQPESR